MLVNFYLSFVERTFILKIVLMRHPLFLKNSNGFSIGEFMVASGITSVLILSTLNLTETMHKARQETELIDAYRLVDQLMGNKGICNATVAGKTLSNQGVNVPAIISPNPGYPPYLSLSPHSSNIRGAIGGNISDENALDTTDIVVGNTIMVGEMKVKDIGTIVDRRGTVRGDYVFRKLEFSVLFALLDNKEAPGRRVQGFTKKYSFVGIGDLVNNRIVACAPGVRSGEREAEKELCEKTMSSSGNTWTVTGCSTNRVKENMARTTVRRMCDATDGIDGSYNASNNTCIPKYWGVDCDRCNTCGSPPPALASLLPLAWKVGRLTDRGDVECVVNGRNDRCTITCDGQTRACSCSFDTY